MKALEGRTILVTRSREQAGGLTGELKRLGARVIESPVIGFEEPEDWGPVDTAIADLRRFDWTIFTSANAVDRFLGRLETLCPGEEGSRRLAGTRLAAVGPATAGGLVRRGLPVETIPSSHRAEGLIEALSASGVKGKRILIPRAEKAREILPDALEEAGAEVTVVTVYRTVAQPVGQRVRAALERGAVDMATFTSPSTVRNLLEGIGGVSPLQGIALAAIGPVTADALEERGLQADVTAPSSTVEGLVAGIVDYFNPK